MVEDSNVDALVCAAASGIPGTLSHLLTEVRGASAPALDRDGERVWEEISAQAACTAVERAPHPIRSAAARYEDLRVRLACGDEARARVIVPDTASPDHRVPAVVYFTDAGRPVRGWHHLTRFTALGAAVIALDAGVPTREGLAASSQETVRLVRRALAVCEAAGSLDEVDAARVHAWGEGLGGGLALMCAARSATPLASAAAANPWPVDGSVGAAFDVAALAPAITCPVFVGTGLLQDPAEIRGQFALVRGASGKVRHRVYPKHGAERINELENELIRFLRSVW